MIKMEKFKVRLTPVPQVLIKLNVIKGNKE
ncbi:uncharacterized protein METZ01_LOCUS501645 [marine metagenome]|uniref:Uncharacterized protein n=1 Tax=marine metagenome TaxID=408172 RepID=A0A383DWC3_9ZZZZ